MFKCLILTMAAVAAMAVTAGGASAQEGSIEIVSEGRGVPCNPCVAHISGESHIISLPIGVMVSTCQDEYEVIAFHDGTGEVQWSGAPHGAPGCNVTNCTAMSPNWPIRAVGEVAAGSEHVVVDMCLRSFSGVELECQVEFGVSQTGSGSHAYEYDATQICGNTRWEFEAADETASPYELVHVS